jgi:hypothetical protein
MTSHTGRFIAAGFLPPQRPAAHIAQCALRPQSNNGRQAKLRAAFGRICQTLRSGDSLDGFTVDPKSVLGKG